MRLRLDPLAQNGISTVVDNTAVVNVGGSTTTSGATSLADLTDVDSTVSSPSDGDIIVYRDAGSDWVLEAKPAGGSNPALNDVTDVTISAVGDNEVLAYDTGTATWINQTASEAGLAASSHSHTATDVTDFDTEVSNNTDVAANTAARHAALTVTDSAEIDFTLTGQDLTASIKAGSIDETKLDTTTNASLDLADSAVQPGDLATVATTGSYSDLSSTPTLGTAAAKNIPATGDASATEVVYGTDTRLTNARTPTSHTHPTTDLTATGGTSTSFLRKDNTWATPTNTTYSEISEAEITTGTATTLRTITGRRAGFLKNTDNHVSGTTNKVYTATEQSKLAGVADGATANPNAIDSVVEDTTPELGGDLNTGVYDLVSPDTTNYLALDDTEITLGTNSIERASINDNGFELGGSGARVTTILDEDTMSSDSATALATQQSIKAYVDAASATLTNKDLSSTTNTFPTGHSVQHVYANYSAANTGSTTIAVDNSVPQNTEGNEFMSATITPKSTTNVLVIDVTIMLSHSAANAWHIAALFQDSTADALHTAANREATATAASTMHFRYVMVAGTTSATTFKVRAGSNAAGTISFNAGAGTSPLFGASVKSSINITEYQA